MGWWLDSRSAKGRALRKRGITTAVNKDAHVPQRRCSRCGCKQIRRSRRRNQWEWLLRAIRLYPYRCEDCNHRFLCLSLRGR
jgi:hypothetical protein